MDHDPEHFESTGPPDHTGASRLPAEAGAAAPGSQPAGRSGPKRGVRYPNAYVWFVFLAALDIMLTYLILHPVLFSHDPFMTEPRGSEVNALADWIVARWDVPGMVGFKFLLVVLVVVLCEIIGRHKEETGRRIAEWAVAITAIPVVLALIQMGFDLYFWFHPPH